MKEYAFLPINQLDPLREEFMPARPAKKILSCVEGARKEEAERNLVINVSLVKMKTDEGEGKGEQRGEQGSEGRGGQEKKRKERKRERE